MEEKKIIYKTTAKIVLNADIPFNSTFDETLRDSDLRIVKTEYIDESNDEFTDYDYEETTGPLGIETDEKWDIECFCTHLTDIEAKWESIIKYPKFAAGSKTRNNWHRIQSKIRKLIEGLGVAYFQILLIKIYKSEKNGNGNEKYG